MKTLFATSVSLAVLAAVTHSAAAAQETPAATEEEQGLGTIVVTAQRRSENIQSAALSINAVDGEMLASEGINSTDDLARISVGLEVQPSGGPYTTFSIRSVSALSGNAFADPAVAVNLAGVYLATPTTFRGMYFDLDRVEILKGPQGTLYGRNATAGAINIIPRRPEFVLGGSAGVDIGEDNRFDFNAALNVPFSDTVALRVAGQRAFRDGYMSNGTSDEDVQAARVSLLFEPSSTFSVVVMGDWAHEGGMGAGATLRKNCADLPGRGTTGVCFVADPYADVSDLDSFYTSANLAVQNENPFLDSNYYGLAVNADLQTAIGTVSLVGGYRESDVRYLTTATSWQLRERQQPRQTSLELRLASPDGNRLGYVFGGYMLDTSMRARANGENGARRNFSDQHTSLTGWTGALFTQLTYSLTDAFRLTGGVRYTYEKKSSDSVRYSVNTVGPDPVIPVVPTSAILNTVLGTQTWNKINWKLGVEFDAAERSLIYANVSTGFKAGGFYYGPPEAQTYEPENVTAFAVGTKNRFFDNTLQVNAEAFYLNYVNQQISFVKLVGAGSTLVTENAGKSHAYGFELSADLLPTDNTRISGQVQWLQAEYDEFSYQTIAAPPAGSLCTVTPGTPQATVDCTGAPTLRSPEWTLLGSIEQTIPMSDGGRFVATADVRYESSYQTDVSYVPLGIGGGDVRINLGLAYTIPSEAITFKAYVENVTNETTVTATTQSNSYANNRAFGTRLLAPRQFGVRALVDF